MLVLSRKIGEQIVMPDQEVVVTVVAIQGNRVRIGITAPSNVSVFREEICPAANVSVGFAAETAPLQDA
jgi:carbon storage regulator